MAKALILAGPKGIELVEKRLFPSFKEKDFYYSSDFDTIFTPIIAEAGPESTELF
ncbi:MAG: hypothetical protein ABII74_04970 [Elusimicrobiota bacterium]